ncbi:MAG: LptF/LptG family permease [Planctomycetota bacterium]|jgi:lipopolysaccharide export LptBFGC system permease protein LptF
MRILDRYVAKNFITGYVIALMVLLGLRVVIDLSINLDEFAEHSDMGTWMVFKNMFNYYGVQVALYFREFAGTITVVAAVFSLGKMTRNNELIAVMASGTSLKRVIAPIIALAVLFTGFLIIDQELIIPRLANQLVRSHDELPGEQVYDVWFMTDGKGSLLCTTNFQEKNQTMQKPTIIIREPIPDSVIFGVLGQIQADSATYNHQKKGWDLKNGRYLKIAEHGEEIAMNQQPEPMPFYESDITPEDIPIRRQEKYKAMLSSAQLAQLAAKGTRIKDLAELYSQKHFRITDPIINMVTLLVALPILVCRDPKAMKTAILISFGVTSACFVVTFACKMVATEVVFNQVRPELWPWVPVFIFLPFALIELDSMKT